MGRSAIQTVLPILSAFLLLAAAAYAFFPGRQLDALVDGERGRATVVAKLAAYSVRPAVAFDDAVLTSDLLRDIAREHGALYLVVYRDGQAFAHAGGSAPRAPSRADRASSAVEHSVLRVDLPLDDEQGRGAMISAGFSVRALEEHAHENRRNAALLALAIAALGLLTTGWTLWFVRRIEELRARAEEASAAKSRFVANVSHELRTPLNGVLGMAALLLGTPLSSRQKRIAARVVQSGRVLLETINDLLDFSKAEAGRIELEHVEVVTEDLLREALEIFALRAHERRLGLVLHIEAGVPERMHTDPLRLRQVLLNLVSNGLKFTEKGAVRVTVRRTDAHLGALELVVEDTGIGMTAEQAQRVFAPFVQADASISRRFGGTGLGLSFVKRVVELNGGIISVTSAPAQGSTFRVLWPVQDAQGSLAASERNFEGGLARDSEPDEEPEHLLSTSLIPHGRAIRVLVVDDNRTNLEVALGMLELLGITARGSSSGREALDLFERGELPPLLLLDCQMPDLDGFSVTRALREREPEGTHLPIIAMTASPGPEERRLAAAAGMDELLGKPLSLEELREVIGRHLPPSVPSNDNGVLDAAAVTQLRTLDAQRPGLLRSVSLRFVREASGRVALLRAALEGGDAEQARHLAHSLKGESRYLGATQVADLAAAIEAHVQNSEPTRALEALRSLEAQLPRALDALTRLAS